MQNVVHRFGDVGRISDLPDAAKLGRNVWRPAYPNQIVIVANTRSCNPNLALSFATIPSAPNQDKLWARNCEFDRKFGFFLGGVQRSGSSPHKGGRSNASTSCPALYLASYAARS